MSNTIAAPRAASTPVTTTPTNALIDKLATAPVMAKDANRIAVDADGHPIQFWYDLPCFTSDSFNSAADAVDWWVGQFTSDVAADETEYATAGERHQHEVILGDLHMYRPSFEIHLSRRANLAQATREVLEHTVVEVHRLNEDDRGIYLAQLITRWHHGGTLDFERFRLGHYLGGYFSMMPKDGECLGVLPDDSQKSPLVMWATSHGYFIDVVSHDPPYAPAIEQDIDRAVALGRARWGATFGGVRFLPVENPAAGKFVHPDGTCEDFRHRDFVQSPNFAKTRRGL